MAPSNKQHAAAQRFRPPLLLVILGCLLLLPPLPCATTATKIANNDDPQEEPGFEFFSRVRKQCLDYQKHLLQFRVMDCAQLVASTSPPAGTSREELFPEECCDNVLQAYHASERRCACGFINSAADLLQLDVYRVCRDHRDWRFEWRVVKQRCETFNDGSHYVVAAEGGLVEQA